MSTLFEDRVNGQASSPQTSPPSRLLRDPTWVTNDVRRQRTGPAIVPRALRKQVPHEVIDLCDSEEEEEEDEEEMPATQETAAAAPNNGGAGLHGDSFPAQTSGRAGSMTETEGTPGTVGTGEGPRGGVGGGGAAEEGDEAESLPRPQKRRREERWRGYDPENDPQAEQSFLGKRSRRTPPPPQRRERTSSLSPPPTQRVNKGASRQWTDPPGTPRGHAEQQQAPPWTGPDPQQRLLEEKTQRIELLEEQLRLERDARRRAEAEARRWREAAEQAAARLEIREEMKRQRGMFTGVSSWAEQQQQQQQQRDEPEPGVPREPNGFADPPVMDREEERGATAMDDDDEEEEHQQAHHQQHQQQRQQQQRDDEDDDDEQSLAPSSAPSILEEEDEEVDEGVEFEVEVEDEVEVEVEDDLRAAAREEHEAQLREQLAREAEQAAVLKLEAKKRRLQREKEEQVRQNQAAALQTHRESIRKEAEEKEEFDALKSRMRGRVKQAATLHQPFNLHGFMHFLGFSTFTGEPFAEDAELKGQLRTAKRMTHPDKQRGKSLRERAMAEEAFKILHSWE